VLDIQSVFVYKLEHYDRPVYSLLQSLPSLAVTVPDLRPNSQDTSAFYLRNIYQVLADPNVTGTSIPSPVAKPPSFSAFEKCRLGEFPLVLEPGHEPQLCTVGHIVTTMGTSISRSDSASPVQPREGERECVHSMTTAWTRCIFRGQLKDCRRYCISRCSFSLAELAILLFDCRQGGLRLCAVWWIVLFLMMYGMITILPIIRHDSPYHSPLSDTSLVPVCQHTSCNLQNSLCHHLSYD
jgi:hypothetical protein